VDRCWQLRFLPMLVTPRWQVFWCDPACAAVDFEADPVLAGLPSLAEWAERHGTRPRQPFLLHTDGRSATEVNEFFASSGMRSAAEQTRRKYATELVTWLAFLDVIGRRWSDAGADEIDAFKFWRMTDEANPRRVAGGTVRSGLVAISAFYEWAEHRYGVANPVGRIQIRGGVHGRGVVEGYRAGPRIVRDRDVKWLDPGGYRRWRDVGLRGLDLAGREVALWRGRSPQRDCAFADGLYGTGLRLSEWASLLQIELPLADPARGFFTSRLASACAKGGRGRRYWMPRHVLADVLAYIEGERAAAVRRAQACGRYGRVAERRILVRVLGSRRAEVRDVAGRSSSVSLDGLGPRERRRLFHEGVGGLVPMALWLNEDGLPRAPHGWQHTFTVANGRLARAGLVGLAVTAHMLRHSFALRWFSVGRLLYERRFAHLDAAELRDFRAQFGDTWYFVMTLLGHRSVATTMNTYLEPFRDLDIDLLIEHAHGAAIEGLLAAMLRDHPQVRTDPLADRTHR
jgi:integrase